MSLKTRGILVVVIGTILGVSLSVGGSALSSREPLPRQDLTWDQARLIAEVMARVKRDYVQPIDDAELLENAIRGMVGDLDRHSEGSIDDLDRQVTVVRGNDRLVLLIVSDECDVSSPSLGVKAFLESVDANVPVQDVDVGLG